MRAVDGHHGGEAGALQALQRFGAETRVMPDTVPHLRLAQFEQNGGHTTDEERYLILEDAPGNGIGTYERLLARRAGEVEAGPRFRQEASKDTVQLVMHRRRKREDRKIEHRESPFG